MPLPLHNSTLSGQRSHMLLAPPPDLCMAYDLNTTELPLLEVELARCESEETRDTQRLHSKITAVVLAILFVSLLGVGMGQTAVYTLGIPYIDDNVASRESPLYFGRFLKGGFRLYKKIRFFLTIKGKKRVTRDRVAYK